MNRSDILFAGGGLAGLTLAVEMTKHSFFREKTIVLIDRDDKQRNDRTWCFWATASEPLPPVPHKTWKHCLFFGKDFEKNLDMQDYRYHMIRGLDFYRWAGEMLAEHPNIRRVQADLHAIDAQAGRVESSLGTFSADIVLNSAFSPVQLLPEAKDLYKPALSVAFRGQEKSGKHVWLLQHFMGWIIETEQPVFKPDTATLMDFRIDQRDETRFVYVLPFTKTSALVEFTVFSPTLCTKAEYEQVLQDYIHNTLNIKSFTKTEQEFGVIPMTDYALRTGGSGRSLNIGTAGGFVKGSSGYAFLRTQRRLRAFARDWAQNGRPNPALLRSPWRFRAYDSIMLRVLQNHYVPGSAFFSDLFRKLPAALVFRFLDEDSTFAEEMRLIQAPPTLPFLKAAIRQAPSYFSI